MMIGLVTLLAGAAGAATLPQIDEPLKTGAAAPGDAAVVIGLEDYAFIADVPYARRDAQAFYDFLVYTRGVPTSQVQLLTSGGREQLIGAVERAVGQLGDSGTLWVYFAGHGAASTSTGQRMLLGDDVRQDPASFDSRAVSLKEIKDKVGDRRVALMVDACYNGLGRGGAELVEGKRFAVPAYAMKPTSKVLEWTAASADQLSGPLDAVRHGAFTYFALGALRGWADGHIDGKPDGQVTAEEARLYVEKALRTVQILDQTPELLVDGATDWVLSSGKLEAAPELRVAAPAVKPSAGTSGGLDASNAQQMTDVLQGIIDRCAAQHPGGDPASEQWMIRFKAKKGKPKGFFFNETNEAQRFFAGEEREHDVHLTSRAACLNREVRALTFDAGNGTVVSRTISVSSSE